MFKFRTQAESALAVQARLLHYGPFACYTDFRLLHTKTRTRTAASSSSFGIRRDPQRPHKPRKPRTPIPFINDLKEIHGPNQALSLFHDYSQMGFKHDYPSYSSLMYKLARSQNFELIEQLLDLIKARDIRCQETVFIALIQHYGKSQLLERSIALFHNMRSFNCHRSVQSFNALLNVLVENDRFSDADNMLKRSSELGCRPNSVSFNIIIKGLLERGELEGALKVLDVMLDRGIQPTVVTYNSLIGFLCRKGEMDKAMRMLDDMTLKRTYPNAVTYALLMRGLCSVGKSKEAKKLMFDMEYRGCKPRPVNFGVLMSDLAEKGKIDEAKSLLLEMKKKQLKPDVVTYNILINYLCKDGRAKEAYKILVEMQMKGYRPTAASYRMLVDGFCGVGDFERGLGVFNAMLTSRHFPRVETCCCLVLGLSKCGKTNDACFVLVEMQKKKMRFQSDYWESLVKDACDSNQATDKLVNQLVST